MNKNLLYNTGNSTQYSVVTCNDTGKESKEQYYQGRMNSFRFKDFPGGSDGKASAYNVGDPGLIPRLGRSSGEGNGNPLQYSCLENPMDGGAWWATVYGVTKSQT